MNNAEMLDRTQMTKMSFILIYFHLELHHSLLIDVMKSIVAKLIY